MTSGEASAGPGRGVIEALVASLRGAGENLAGQGYQSEALALLHKAAAVAPSDDEIRAALAGVCRAAGGRFETGGAEAAAESSYRQADTLSPGKGDGPFAVISLLRRRSDRLDRQGDSFGAAMAAAQAHLLQPADDELAGLASRRTAKALLLDGAAPDQSRLAGLSGYCLALAANPDNSRLAATLAEGLCDHAEPMIFDGRHVDAVGPLREAARLAPGAARPARLLALSLCQAAVGHYNYKRFAEAEAALWEALSLAPDLPDAARMIELCARHSERQVIAVADPVSTKAAGKLCELLQIHDAAGEALVRKGLRGDGGYVMVDRGLSGVVAYSLGVGNDVSWDLDMASAGCRVFQYDHTIERLPSEHANFHWSKLGVAARPGDDPRFRTLDELIAANGHGDRGDMILKIDIEGYEWDLLAEIPPATLGRFTQIVGEFHHMPGIADPDKAGAMLAALERLAEQFALVHMHANNWGTAAIVGGVTLPRHLELTFLRRDAHRFVRTARKFPGGLDYPNVSGLPEYVINPFG